MVNAQRAAGVATISAIDLSSTKWHGSKNRQRSRKEAAREKRSRPSTTTSGRGAGSIKKPAAGARKGDRLRRIIRDAVRSHVPKEETGFLCVDEYVVDLFEKYGDGGLLSKKRFMQAVAGFLGDDGMAPQDLERAFDSFKNGSGFQGGLSVDEFLEGVLMSEEERRETAGKLRDKIRRKFGKRDDQLRELYDFMAEPNRGDSASARVLCEIVDEWLKVDIAEPEAIFLLDMMDLDRDGVVSVADFMGFIGPQGEEIVEATSLAARFGSAIVDIEVSTTKEEERELEESGYKVVDANVNEGTFGPPIHVWYRRLKHGGAGVRLKPLVDVMIDPKNVNSALVVDGYQCIDRSLNTGTPLGASNYLWVRRATTEEEETRDAVVDLAVTMGKAKDRSSDIHTPPARGFIQVPGNLNKRTFGKDIFLWYRPIKSRQPNAFAGTTAFHVASTLTDERRKVEMTKNTRRHIRQHVAPTEVSEQPKGPVDYAVIFNKHDKKNKGFLSRAQLGLLLKDVGLNIEAKDIRLLFGRIDHDATNGVSREEFLNFVALTEDEIDEVCDTLRRKYAAGRFSAAGVSRKEQASGKPTPFHSFYSRGFGIKALRTRFAQVDENRRGVLSREQFSNMLGRVGLYLTAHEQELVKERFDPSGDGRVDLLNFVNFFLMRDRMERRSAARVTKALDAMREDALSKQADKAKKQTIDSVDSNAAWQDIKKRYEKAYKKAFPGFLTSEDIGQALERMNIRLSHRELHQLVMRLSPTGSGHVSEEDFHHLVCVPPRDVGTVLKIVEKDALPGLIEAYRRLRHCQHRKVFQETLALGGTTSASFGATLGTSLSAASRAGGRSGGIEATTERSSPSCTRIFRSTGSLSRLGHTANDLWGGGSSPLIPSAKGTVGGVSLTGTGIWDGDGEDPALREEFTKKMAAFVKMIRPDDQGFTTIENIRDGLAPAGNKKPDTGSIHETEWAHLAQLVGADEAEHNVVDAYAFLKGICAECLEEHETNQTVTLEDVAHTEEEALNLVCEDLVKMIEEEAKIDPKDESGEGDPIGRDVFGEGSKGVGTARVDYSKPFELFDEQGLGVIPVDQFRLMLYRLRVDSVLRERQMVALIDRFDVDRKGEVTLDDFIAFTQRKTWGQEAEAELLGNTGRAELNDDPVVDGSDAGDADSDGEDARFQGLRITGSKRGDTVAVAIMTQLRKSFPNKPQEARRELSEGLRALDHGKEKRLPASGVVRALKRLGIELNMKERKAEHSLRVFEVRAASYMASYTVKATRVGAVKGEEGGKPKVDLTFLVEAVGRAWRAEDLHSKQHSLTGNTRLDGKVVRLQREFRDISTTKYKHPKTGAITYSYKMGKIFRKLDVHGDGTLTALEFKRGLRKLGIGEYLAERDVRRIFRSFDRDLSGSVDYHEFCDFLLHGTVAGKKKISIRESRRSGFNNKRSFLFAGRKGKRSRHRQWRGNRTRDGDGTDFSGVEASCSSTPSRWGSSSSSSGSGCKADGGNDFCYDSGSGDGLFEPPPDPLMDVTRDAMVTFAPSAERQQRVRNYFLAKDKNSSGKISESDFHQFLRRSGIESALGRDTTSSLIERFDPRGTGYIPYAKFLEKVLHVPKPPAESERETSEEPKEDKKLKAEDTNPILHRIQEAVLQSLAKNRPFHGMFRLSDHAGTGLVTLDAFRHTLNMLGAKLSQDEAQMVADRLAARADGLVDYEGLYRLLLDTPPPPHLCRRPSATPYAGGGVLLWPPPVVLPSTEFAAGILGQGCIPAGGVGRGDPVLEDVASRVRQRVMEKTQIWGPSFSLSRQFEFHDPRNRGMVTVQDFSSVMQQLGVYLSALETEHLKRMFDRYGDGAIDYTDFCQRILFDQTGMEALAGKINARFVELRRKGVDTRSAFDMYDLSKTGFVSRRDFREAMRKLQIPITEHQLQALCSRFGQLGDPDSVSYEDLFFFAQSSMPELSTSGVRASVNGSGYDGIRGAGSGPILAKDNVQKWYSGVASGEEKRQFDQIYDRLRSFKHQQDLGIKKSTPPDLIKRDKEDAQVRSCPHKAVIPIYKDRYGSPPPSPTHIAGNIVPNNSPSRTGARIWGWHTPLSRKGSLSISRGMCGQGCWMCPVCFFIENASTSKLCEICQAPNPGRKDSEVLQQCPNCTFANPELSIECQMCGEPLPYGRARRKNKSAESLRGYQGLPGWDTGGRSDDDSQKSRRTAHRGR
ncbi:unnamed protein product, partial [Ascophyllum nodosum]